MYPATKWTVGLIEGKREVQSLAEARAAVIANVRGRHDQARNTIGLGTVRAGRTIIAFVKPYLGTIEGALVTCRRGTRIDAESYTTAHAMPHNGTC